MLDPSLSRKNLLAAVHSVVVKIGTNALSDPRGKLDLPLISHLADQVANLHVRGLRVSLVSSGAIGAGITELKLAKRPKDLPMLQAAAAVGQGILMNHFHAAFARHAISVGQILVTRSDFENRGRYLNLRNCIHALHHTGSVPIINENDTVAVEEIRFGDNDLIAAHVANLLRADLLILLTVVDGLLDGEGRVIPLIEEMDENITAVVDAKLKSSGGTGGMASKLVAAGTVQTAGEPVLIANGKTPDILTQLLDGQILGTLVLPGSRRLSARSRWIALTAKTSGLITVDAGAADALRANKSLLASGITATTGDYQRGDAVAIADPHGHLIARGLSNYAREEVEKIRGHRSSKFAELLHTDTYYDEVIHRDDLVLEG